MPFQPVDYDPFAQGDPETTGAVQASQAMEPAVTDYLSHTGDQFASSYDPSRSFAQNALDPQGINNAMGIALAFGPGAIKGFHGSPNPSLTNILADPPARQFDNATSQFGAFFAPNEAGATRYAGDAGRIYPKNVDLQNPYEMPWRDFAYFQSPNKGPNGEAIPGEGWAERAEALKQEAAQLRQTLTDAGHDGIIVKNSRGQTVEFSSFNDVPVGIKAYHGSPYNFDAFDASKINTGEGAQSYGHGLYFAENQGVAQSYRDALSAPVTNDYVLSDNSGKIPDWAGNQIVQYPPGHQYYNDVIDRLTNLFHSRIAEQDAQWPSQPWMADANKQGLQEIVDNLGRLKSGEVTLEKPQPTGKMYEVNIDAHPDTFLDWDKPLSQQSIHVQEALGWTPELRAQYDATTKGVDDALYNALNRDADPAAVDALSRRADELNRTVGFARDATGADIIKGNSIFDRASDADKAAELQKRGINGIRYLDQGSRAAGNGTSNYVVFDPKMIEIVKKYGLAPLIAGGAMTLSGNADAATHAIPTEHNPFTVPVDYDPFAAGGF